MITREEQISTHIEAVMGYIRSPAVRIGVAHGIRQRMEDYLQAAWNLLEADDPSDTRQGPDIMDLIEQLPSGLKVELKAERYGDNTPQYHLTVSAKNGHSVFLSTQGKRAMVVDILARYVAAHRKDMRNDHAED